MPLRFTDRIVDVLTTGNRPIRILLFGGIFAAWILLTVLARVFGVETDIGGDINLPNVILIMVSLLAGFGFAYGIVHWLDSIRRRRGLDEN